MEIMVPEIKEIVNFYSPEVVEKIARETGFVQRWFCQTSSVEHQEERSQLPEGGASLPGQSSQVSLPVAL